MKRLLTGLAFVLATACGGNEDSCVLPNYPSTVDLPPDPTRMVVAAAGSGPGKLTFLNSDPAPGGTVSGCGATVGGCQDQLKLVFNLTPDVELRSQRLHVTLTDAAQAQLECFSTGFDLPAGQSFAIGATCPSSPSRTPTPFRSATLTVEVGRGDSTITQTFKATYGFSQ
jgi:hypothetical protein